MKIITARSYYFTGDHIHAGKSHQINANDGQPQEVPDWLAETPAFRRLTNSGEIQQIQVKPPSPAPAPAEFDEIVDGKVAEKPKMPRLPKKSPAPAANAAPISQNAAAEQASAPASAPPSPEPLGLGKAVGTIQEPAQP